MICQNKNWHIFEREIFEEVQEVLKVAVVIHLILTFPDLKTLI